MIGFYKLLVMEPTYDHLLYKSANAIYLAIGQLYMFQNLSLFIPSVYLNAKYCTLLKMISKNSLSKKNP
ncbi:MAG: hypothetical protein CMH46_10730 [Muricauda sp.]|nr:hypothetical protein [Allomuricauda sp.]